MFAVSFKSFDRDHDEMSRTDFFVWIGSDDIFNKGMALTHPSWSEGVIHSKHAKV